jgi:hypothetical protein
MNPQTYIFHLGCSFPSLRSRFESMPPGTFDADRLAEELGVLSHGERHAALFLLNVWNPGYARENAWHFDAVEALAVWDEPHRRAFLAWAAHPLFP